jgi:CheY-like chemotaxis protein
MAKNHLRIRLITWKDDRASKLRGELEASGFTVDAKPFEPSTLKALANDSPDAVVIDLGRLPSHGRDVGVAVRTRASTRHLPLVFVDGSADKVDRTRQQLPDAIYTVSGRLNDVVRHAIAHPSRRPVVPASNLAGYSGTPLPKKLGIKGGSTVALVGAPADFEATLGDLPEATTILEGPSPEAAVTLWFLDSFATLEEGIEEMAEISGGGRLWICWPKKASGIATDVTQNQVRSTGLAAGIVDFKICAIDATWSGLCFTRRKT